MTHTRNTYIDFLRGIAVLGIIAIHTAFWSGQGYTPLWFRSLTLLLDVPFFFFLSGWASSYNEGNVIKACKSIAGIWLKWIYFISVIAVVCLLPGTIFQGGGVNNFRDLVQNYMFNVSFECFPVVGGSIWFIPRYFTVVLVNQVVLACISLKKDYTNYKRLYNIVLLVLFFWTAWGHSFFGIDQYFWFYSFFWMLGNTCREVKIRSFKRIVLMVIGLVIAWISFGYLTDISPIDLQSAKFPPGPMYFVASMFAILIAIYMRNSRHKRENGLLIHIGKNAIYYYFGQGIGSSLIYLAVSRIQINNWFMKWLVIYACNVVITFIISEVLYNIYNYLERVIRVISSKMVK